ncbi:hypothetical protein DKX38_013092 [Salix brachista]|uniref:WPP domain-containing protein n=1 Tax=Salix brachista TaxID=2182728 RepID=A0A5N5LQP9_9ROSI|nr:hypothetical protein DKX38_013092 [Salix brachista]
MAQEKCKLQLVRILRQNKHRSPSTMLSWVECSPMPYSHRFSEIPFQMWKGDLYPVFKRLAATKPQEENSQPDSQPAMTTPTESVQCFGRKKTAVAVTHCKRGRGLIKINGCPIELVEPEILRFKAYEPVLLLGRQRFAGVDMRIRVKGGGHTSQIYAIRQSIAKALVAFYQKYVDEQSKKEIKDILVRYDRTLLVADPRRDELDVEMLWLTVVVEPLREMACPPASTTIPFGLDLDSSMAFAMSYSPHAALEGKLPSWVTQGINVTKKLQLPPSKHAWSSSAGLSAMDSTELNSQRRPFSIKLWPPSQNTRQMLVVRVTDNLTTNSIFTQKYGSLSKEEAEDNAKRIEDVAFAAANEHYEKEPDGDGSSAVQLYAKECSKLILEALKRGPTIRDEKEVLASDKASALPETVFDISKGVRSFIEVEEAEEILKPLKEPGNSYTKICFSNRSFGLEAAHVAEPILASIKDQLKEVDLSDFIAGRPEAEALEVMNIFSCALEGSILKSLNLSNNALGEKGVRAFGALLRSQSCLEELYLMNDGISEEAAEAVCELIPSTEKLKVLQFHNNMTGDKGALAISRVVKCSPVLQDFQCSSTRVGSEGGIALSKALETCIHLKKLDLRDNMFGKEAGVALSKALSKYAGLTEVYLSYLNLEDEGAMSIARALKESAPSLEVLDMAGNDITAEAAPTVAACIAEKQHLTKLNLAENELKDEGAIQISKVLEDGHLQLKEVDMSNNSLGRSGARVLAKVAAQKPEFKYLNIDGNFISDEGIDEVNELFEKFPDRLGSFDENDPEGGGDEDEEESGEGVDDEHELERKLENLEVNKEE